MSDFGLKINRLRGISYSAALQDYLASEVFFEVEYFFHGQGNYVVVQPILISNVVVFLVHSPGGDEPSMALVYNKKDVWSDIEKGSTGLTGAIGAAIENYYSTRYLPWSANQKDNRVDVSSGNHLLN
jgi:hypothetical protein